MTESDFFDRTEAQLLDGLRCGKNRRWPLRTRGFVLHSRGWMGITAVRSRPLAVFAACTTGIVGGIVATVLVLSSGASSAYADWSAIPARATTTQLATAASQCDALESETDESETPPPSVGGHPVLSELRGIYTAAIYITAGHVYTCLYAHKDRQNAVIFNSFGLTRPRPAAGKLSVRYTNWGSTGVVPRIFQPKVRLPKGTNPRHMTRGQNLAAMRRFEGLGYGSYTLGQVGRGITEIRLGFPNRGPVTATVENGWYYAWWPWFSDPTTVTITTSSGTKTSPMAKANGRPSGLPRPGCQPDSQGCVFTVS